MEHHVYTVADRLSAPCQVNLEITTACNHRCRYCYNFWRHDPSTKISKMSMKDCDTIIDDLIKNKVMNVIISGGEPFNNYPVMLHAIKRLTDAGIMTTCNSNMTLATKEQLKELKEAGLPHILTSLSSYDPETNDRVFNSKGAFVKAVRNIINAVNVGIKISINNIITKSNKDHVYKTGLLAHAIGASNYFATRCGVSLVAGNEEFASELVLTPEEYLAVLDKAVQVRNDTGIAIYSLYQYPVCMLRDMDKYPEFFGRGCPAGKKMVCINANGNIHACNHETEVYGNALTTGVAAAWAKMDKWRDGSLIPDACKKCKWYAWCEGGCRMAADGIDKPDYLCQGSTDTMPDPITDAQKSIALVTTDAKFRARKGLRYREENGFWLIHILGAWITKASPEAAKFLIDAEKVDRVFKMDEFPATREELANLLTKNIIVKE